MSETLTEKKYLKWYNKVGYGTGDVAGNVVYAFLSAFVLIYLTDTMGMKAGVVATLMMLSKFFDGFSDFVFGFLMDKTHARMGKARPWMFYGFFGCAITLIGCFAIPMDMPDTAKYAWFFICYTLLNSVFYTANNLAYGALTALVTKNKNERVQMGSLRFMFAFGTSMLIQTVTMSFVDWLGGDASAWRLVAVAYAIVGLATNTLAVFSVRELSDAELSEGREHEPEDDKMPILQSLKIVVGNKYFLLMVIMFIIMQISMAMSTLGIFFMRYVLDNDNLLGPFAWALNAPQILMLALLPVIVAKVGSMWKVDVVSYIVAIAARAGFILAGYMANVPLMLAFLTVSALAQAPLQGTLTPLLAEACENVFLRTGKRVEGLMFSCTSLGTKIGGGVGTALTGLLLDSAGYVSSKGDEKVLQPDSVIDMLHITYLWLPSLACVVILLIVLNIDVEARNAELRKQQGLVSAQPDAE